MESLVNLIQETYWLDCLSLSQCSSVMKNTLERPPRTIMEVYKNLPEGTLAELIDNIIYMSPSPVYRHQEVLFEIASRLREKLTKESGKVVIAPFDIYLDDTSNAVQPDVVVILKDNKGILNEDGHFHGVPDIIIEILSPGNSDHDLVVKKNLYQRFGVKEYWIVNPENKISIGYSLEKHNQYSKVGEVSGEINSRLLSLSLKF